MAAPWCMLRSARGWVNMTERFDDDRFIRCEPMEVATGWPYGLLPPTPLPDEPRSPREALEDAIRPALRHAPCYVTFSGGRDSSAVLAVATALARREGHDLPIPVTRVYPNLPATDEDDWQQLVINHLQLNDWVRLEFTGGETEILGAAAQDSLLARGVFFPAPLHAHATVFGRLEPGSLLTGEGGDAALGSRRGTALALLRRRRANPAILWHAVDAALPRPIQRVITGRMMRRHSLQTRWLKPAALRRHVRRATEDIIAEPLLYPAGTWFVSRLRSFVLIRHNHTAMAAEFGLRASDPLLDDGFLAALARVGGRLGFTSRTSAMGALFSDVLPRPVLIRNTKAAFNQAHGGSSTRDFARTWDGTGVDPDLVDIERLRELWLTEDQTMITGLLLHSAWLASQGASK